MATVVGLALGTVALASLFSTCLELVSYFEVGRNHEYDFDRACSKLELLRARLDSWGRCLNIEDVGHEAAALRRHWSDEQDVIARGLFGIQSILGDAEKLKEKYKLKPSKSRALSLPHSRAKCICSSQESVPERRSVYSQRFSLLRRSTKWAIRDKEKFDVLISDLEFFISNLEQVLGRIGLSRRTLRNFPHTGANLDGQHEADEEAREALRDLKSARNIGGHVFEVKNSEGQSAVLQGTHEDVAAPEIAPNQRNFFTIGNMKDQAIALQGVHSLENLKLFHESRLAIIREMNGSKNRGQAQQGSDEFQGLGR